MVTISGLDKEYNDDGYEDTRGLVEDFVKKKLKIKEGIDFAFSFRIGAAKQNKARNVLVKLIHPIDKQLIYDHVSNLKNCRNKNNERYFINDYMSEKDSDQKQRIKDIVMENRRMPISHQMQMETKGNQLFVIGDKYVTEVEPPTTKDFLLTTKTEEKELNKLRLVAGPSDTKDGSLFKSYAAKVQSLDDVKQHYHKIKVDNASATHIVCAYMIFGIKHHIYQDYADDREIGAGRKILSELKSSKAFNIAVFVLRLKSEGNIGPVCFQIFADLAKQAMQLIPGATHFGKDFQHQDRILKDGLNRAGVRPRRGTNHSARGGRPIHVGHV